MHSLCLNVRVICFQVLQVQHFQENTLVLYSPLYYINGVLIRTVFQLSEILSKTRMQEELKDICVGYD